MTEVTVTLPKTATGEPDFKFLGWGCINDAETTMTIKIQNTVTVTLPKIGTGETEDDSIRPDFSQLQYTVVGETETNVTIKIQGN